MAVASGTLQRANELLSYRDLVRNLVVRDLKVRYKQSVLGFLWSLFNPLLLMIVFSVVFTVMMPNNQIRAFPAFILSALLPWNWCATSVGAGTVSVVGNANLIKKVYFPRELLPISVVLSNLVNYLLALIVLLVVLLAYHMYPSWVLVYLPVIIAIQIIFLSGLVLFLSSINVAFRDTEVIVEVAITAWFFLTPVFYDIGTLLPTSARVIYWVNPMASLVESYRLIFYNGAAPDPAFLFRMFLTSAIVFVIGWVTFQHFSPRFGEEL